LARLTARFSVNLPMPALRSADGLHEEKYDDPDIYKALTLFEERITAMKESVALEASDKVDSSNRTTLVTSASEDAITALRKKQESATAAAAAKGVLDPNILGIDSDL
jgi:hypothetical protein